MNKENPLRRVSVLRSWYYSLNDYLSPSENRKEKKKLNTKIHSNIHSVKCIEDEAVDSRG